MSVYLHHGNPLRGVTVAGAKNVAVLNRARRGMTFQNVSDTDMRVTEDNTDASASVGYIVGPRLGININTWNRVSVYCAAAGKAYEAVEF